MSKTLVTGAGGFIGSHVVRLLLEKSEEVRVLLRPGEPTTNLDGLDVEIRYGDIRDVDAVDQAMIGCESLYHLAAIYAQWRPDINEIYDVNVNGTQNVMEAALRRDVGRVVHTSSIAAIGISEGTALSDEETPFNQWQRGNPYVLSKYVSQLIVENMAHFHALPVVIVNPAFPFGERDREPTPTGELILQVAHRNFPGYLEGGMNVVDVEDVARGHLLAAEKGRIGEKYLLAHTNISTRDFMQTVAGLLEVPPPPLQFPAPVAMAAGYVMELVSDYITQRPPLFTAKSVAYTSQFLYFDNSRSRRELGLEYRPFQESLQRSIRWFRENDYICPA